MKVLFAFVIAICFIFGGTNGSKKNILFLGSDDLRPNLGTYSNANSRYFKSPSMYTPNLDQLAQEGVVFDQAYTQYALCGPSRASVLTGRRPETTRVTSNDLYFRKIGSNFTTIPQFFKQNGYHTIGGGKVFHFNFGKASGWNDPISWTEHFHMAYDFWHFDDFTECFTCKYSWKALSTEELEKHPLQDMKESDYIIRQLQEKAPDALNDVRPFFLAFGTKKPHLPFYFPEEFLDYYPNETIGMPYNPNCPVDMPDMAWHKPSVMGYDDCSAETIGIPDLGQINVTFPEYKIRELRRAYYATVTYVDQLFGLVLDELKNLGLENNTIVVFWGDHGWQLGEHAEWGKHTAFEVSNRTPLIIKIPGMPNKGKHTEKLVELVDLFPTLVEAAGFDPLEICPENSNDYELCSEGSSLLPLINDPMDENWKDAVFWQQRRNHDDNDIPTKIGYSIRTEGYRYTEWIGTKNRVDHAWEPDWDNQIDHEELYDLQLDPQENINLFNYLEYQTIKEELSIKLRRGWRKKEIANDDKI